MIRQPFHLVEISPWPLTASIGALTLTTGLTTWFHLHISYPLILASILIIISMIQWWRDVIREATFLGHHTTYVTKGLRWGIILFITSEVLFFFAFFWAFFHRRLSPTQELGCCWPPTGIHPLNPFRVPLLNTAVLLASGVTVTWAHHSLIQNNRTNTIQALILTISLGVYFTILQAGEYVEASFTIADRVYGSTFFVATGFHGAHVLIGSTFLFVCLIRAIIHQYSSSHHFGFEAAAWYWHFVDVVWICLYLCIYWWSSLYYSVTCTKIFDILRKSAILFYINELFSSYYIIFNNYICTNYNNTNHLRYYHPNHSNNNLFFIRIPKLIMNSLSNFFNLY